MKEIENILEKMIAWLLSTQFLDTVNSDCFGMYPAWIDSENMKPSFGYSEITGYGLSLNSFLTQSMTPLTEIANQIESSAKLAFEWIKKRYNEDGYFKTRIPNDRIKGYLRKTMELCYLFDSGIILNGLVNYAQFTEEDDVLDTAFSAASSLIEDFYCEDGRILPLVSKGQDNYLPSPLKWSVQTTPFLSKAAIGIAYLNSVSRQKKYSDFIGSMVRLLKTGIDKHKKLRTYNETGRAHFHPLLYAIEAAFCLGRFLSDSELMQLAQKNLEIVFEFQNEKGALPSLIWNDQPVYAFRSDIHFQAIRMGIVLDHYFNTKRFKSHVSRAQVFVFSEGIWENENEAAAWYGIDAEPIESETPRNHAHLNVWSTMFGIQALHFYINSTAVDFFINHPTYIV